MFAKRHVHFVLLSFFTRHHRSSTPVVVLSVFVTFADCQAYFVPVSIFSALVVVLSICTMLAPRHLLLLPFPFVCSPDTAVVFRDVLIN
jgi:hypothetical protein